MECHVTNVVTYDYTIEPFRKGPPKMRRFSGRLREVIGYEIEPKRVYSEKRSRQIKILAENLLNAISKLRYV